MLRPTRTRCRPGIPSRQSALRGNMFQQSTSDIRALRCSQCQRDIWYTQGHRECQCIQAGSSRTQCCRRCSGCTRHTRYSWRSPRWKWCLQHTACNPRASCRRWTSRRICPQHRWYTRRCSAALPFAPGACVCRWGIWPYSQRHKGCRRSTPRTPHRRRTTSRCFARSGSSRWRSMIDSSIACSLRRRTHPPARTGKARHTTSTQASFSLHLPNIAARHSQLQGESSSPLVRTPPDRHLLHWSANPASLSR